MSQNTSCNTYTSRFSPWHLLYKGGGRIREHIGSWKCKKLQAVLGELPRVQSWGTAGKSRAGAAELLTTPARELPPSSSVTAPRAAHVRVQTHTFCSNRFYFWKGAWEAESRTGRLRTTRPSGLEGISAGSPQSIALLRSRGDLTISELSPKDGCPA